MILMGRGICQSMLHQRRTNLALATAAVACVLGTVCGPAEAGFSSSSFCDRQAVKDYQAPFRRMPSIPSPPASGQLPFAPKGTFFELIPDSPLVPLGESLGRVGFAFGVPSGSLRTFHLDWIVQARLVRIARNGDEGQSTKFKTLRLGTLTHSAFDQIGQSLLLASRPAYYRLEVVFNRSNGKRLGRYGQYIRVLRPKFAARLGVDQNSLQAGESLTFRVENLGTERVSYPPEFSFESLQGGTWINQPLDVRWPRIILAAGPGEAGRCQTFLVPPETSPGRYRITKPLRGSGRTLTVEFDVKP